MSSSAKNKRQILQNLDVQVSRHMFRLKGVIYAKDGLTITLIQGIDPFSNSFGVKKKKLKNKIKKYLHFIFIFLVNNITAIVNK